MKSLNAIATAELSASIIQTDFKRYVDLINRNINPPKPLTENDVYIRAMFVVSDKVNSYGGRFDRADLPELARKFIDSPLLIGHDKSGLPVARNFWAETVEKDDVLWTKCYFYWHKRAPGAEKLRVNIDSGIYKECSVSFVYNFPECSDCGEDFRSCGHDLADNRFFYYREIEKILETSLVYRGSIPDTFITDKLNLETDPKARQKQLFLRPMPERFSSLGRLGNNGIRAIIDNRNFILTPDDLSDVAAVS